MRGLLSGTSVWVPAEEESQKELECLVTGLVDGGKDMADVLYKLLYPPSTPRKMPSSVNIRKDCASFFTSKNYPFTWAPLKSSNGHCLVRFGAEESLFLSHTMKVLHVYKGMSSVDPWIHAVAHKRAKLRRTNGNDLLDHFTNLSPRFPFRYLAYLHSRSKGWLTRAGLQFGSDFVLYHAHPTMVHSKYSMLVLPTTFKLSNPVTEVMRHEAEWKRFIELDTFVGHFEQLHLIDPTFSWNEIRAVMRVQSQVRKIMILCYVGVLNSFDYPLSTKEIIGENFTQLEPLENDIQRLVDRGHIQEYFVGRWTARNT